MDQHSFEIVMKGTNFFVSMTEFDLIRHSVAYSINEGRFVFEMQDKTSVKTSEIPEPLLPIVSSKREIVFAKINMKGIRDAVCIKKYAKSH